MALEGVFLENGMTLVRLHLHIYGISISSLSKGWNGVKSIHKCTEQIHRTLDRVKALELQSPWISIDWWQKGGTRAKLFRDYERIPVLVDIKYQFTIRLLRRRQEKKKQQKKFLRIEVVHGKVVQTQWNGLKIFSRRRYRTRYKSRIVVRYGGWWIRIFARWRRSHRKCMLA